MRVGLALAVLLGSACGATGPRPSGAPLGDRLDRLSRDLFASLASGDPARVRALQAPDGSLEDLFEPQYVDIVLMDRRMDSSGADRVAEQWLPLAGSRYAGYCARGVGPGTSTLPGLESRVSSIAELVIVARDAAGVWAGVLRDLVEDRGSYRLVRWTIEAPRRDHFELEQWSCDFGRRDGTF